jgi:hypothetical protein
VGNSYRVVLETLPTPQVETGGYSQVTPDGVGRNGTIMGSVPISKEMGPDPITPDGVRNTPIYSAKKNANTHANDLCTIFYWLND